MRTINQALLVITLAASLGLTGQAHAERSIIDMAGRTVRVPDEVRKVYAVGHCIPIVAAVAPDKLANGYRLSEAAKQLISPLVYLGKAIPSAGMRMSDEEVVRMGPDLVVMERIAGAEEQARRLEERLHLPVVLVDQDLLKTKNAFAFLGDLLGRPEQARTLIEFVARHIDPIGEKARTIPRDRRLRVYYAEGPDGLATNPAGSIHTQVLDFVGGINVADVAGIPGEATNAISMEQLYVWQPDLILVWTPNADKLTTWRAIVGDPLWQRLTAVKAGRVIQTPWLPFSWFDRPPGSNRLLGVVWLAQTLYPEVYRLDLEALSREYFRKFYHRELSAAEARALLGSARPTASGVRP